MDSEAAATVANPITIEEDYVTASESDDSMDKTHLPIEKGENPDRVLSESPDSDGPDEKVEVLGGGSDPKPSNVDGKDEEEEKDEVLGSGSTGEARNSAVEVEGELKGEEIKPVEVEENGFSLDEDEKKVEFDGGVESEIEAKIPVLEVKEVSIPVEIEENEKVDEILDESRKSELETTSNVIEEEVVADPKAEIEKSVATDADLEPSVEAKKDFVDDSVGSEQNLDGEVGELKPVEVELKAAVADKLDAVVESEGVNEETGAFVDEKETNVVDGSVEEKTSAIGDENFEEAVEDLVEPKDVEEEIKVVVDENENNVADEPVVEEEETKAVAVENLEGVGEDLKPVEVEINATDDEKIDVVLESKAMDEKESKVNDELEEYLDVEEEIKVVVDENENNVVDEPVVEEEETKAVEVENLEGVGEDLKPVEVEINATDDEKIDDVLESKAMDEKESKVNDELEEYLVVDEETKAVVTEDNGGADDLDANQDLDEGKELKAVEKGIAAESDKNEAADSASTLRSLGMVTELEKAVLNSEQVLTELDVKPRDSGWFLDQSENVEPSSALAEDSKSKEVETELSESSGVIESVKPREISIVADDDENPAQSEGEEEFEEDGNVSDEQPRVAILDSSETAKQIIKEMEEGSSNTSFESSRSYQHQMEGQIVSDSDEEVDTDEEGDGKEEMFDSAALAALLKAATGGSSDGNITITSQDGTRVFSMDRPAGLGSSAPSLRPGPARSARPTLFSPSELAVTGEPDNEMDEEEKKLHDKVENIRVKFLRLVMRLGHTPEDTVAAQVLYRLSLAEGIRRGRQMGRAFSIETAKKKAIQLEAVGEEDLNFSCNILVLGKTGVGKSATINSIFGEEKSQTNAFQATTNSVREISGIVDGVKIRIIDTPGLKSSVMDQATNRRILSSIKKHTKKCPPDIVLYVDRLDTQTRDFNDLPLLRTITSALGSSIWFNAIVALTHAASAPPEGPNGSPLSYEVFIAQRSHVVQHSIRQAAGDMRLMNPVALVENHPSCRRNREGQRVLPNGISWRPQMLLLCYSSKILSEANSLLKLQDPSPAKLFGFRLRSPPLPYLLSTLLQSRAHPKLPNDQGGDNGDSDIDLDDFSDAEDEEEDEYDQLPPFKPLKRSQIAKLTKEQKRAYFDEYDYRVKLLQKKQFKEEIRRLKEMKKRGQSGVNDSSPYGDIGDDFDQDGAPAAVAVPLPDMVLPPSFDCDVPTYRYRFLEPTSQLLTRPVLDTHAWDHDCGYDGVSIEESLAIASRFPTSIAAQITKDKKDFTIHLDSSIAAKLRENGSALAGFDIQSVGKQLAYILRGETKFKTLKKNKTTVGTSVTFLGETVATGLKVEDQLMIGKRVGLVASTGAVRAQGDTAYGANLEARLREKDYPIGQAVSTLGLSLMKWRGDLALGSNLQSQVSIGRNSKVAVRVSLNNKRSGQITVRTSSSEHLQLALVGIIPVAASIFRSIWPGELEYAH